MTYTTEKPDSPITVEARNTRSALRAILNLDDDGNPKWHEYVQMCRDSVCELARSPSQTTDDVLEKGRILALLTPCSRLTSLRHLLAQSILYDVKSLGIA